MGKNRRLLAALSVSQESERQRLMFQKLNAAYMALYGRPYANAGEAPEPQNRAERRRAAKHDRKAQNGR